jgi:ABC-type bacteriocin/lantibiotic exporter with double-glycine peptidase domain
LVQAKLARIQVLVGLLRALSEVGKRSSRRNISTYKVLFYLPFIGMMTMRVFLVSLTAVVVIAVAAAVVLDTFQKPASDAFSTSAVRL